MESNSDARLYAEIKHYRDEIAKHQLALNVPKNHNARTFHYRATLWYHEQERDRLQVLLDNALRALNR